MTPEVPQPKLPEMQELLELPPPFEAPAGTSTEAVSPDQDG